MFTGIVQEIGRIEKVAEAGGGRRLTIDAGALAPKVAVGDSLAVDGVCLTAEEIDGARVRLFASPESLRRTTLADCRPGRRVNLEQPLRAGDQIGGHIVQGHVDAVGKLIAARQDSAESWILRFSFPPELRPLMVEKGSIAIDGVSLTIAAIDETEFSVAVIPQTMKVTLLGEKAAGAPVNLECDILAKQVHQFLTRYLPEGKGQVSMDLLERAGFLESKQ